MANQLSIIKIQNGSLRIRPQFSLWCTVFHCLFSFLCVSSSCLGVDNVYVTVYPEAMAKVQYGDPLELFCVSEKFPASDLQFTLGGDVLPSEIINSTTRRLFVEKPEKQVNVYFCSNKYSNQKCLTRVVVDQPPMNVIDFECTSKNLDVLNCTWTTPKIFSNVNYSLTFFVNGNAVYPCNVIRIGNSGRYCSWDTNRQPRYRQMDVEYFFRLTSCNVFGCNHENFTLDHFSVVKPDPPSKPKVLRVDTHSVLLRWKIPNNMAHLLLCGVDHRIEYQIAKIDNSSYFRRVDASSLPANNETYTFLLSDLPYAHMQYEVRIYIKPKKAVKEEFWSDFVYVLFNTASDPGNLEDLQTLYI